MHETFISLIRKNNYNTDDINMLEALIKLSDMDELQDYLIIASQYGNIEFFKLMEHYNIELNFDNFALLHESIIYKNNDCAKYLYNLYKDTTNIEKYNHFSTFQKMKEILC